MIPAVVEPCEPPWPNIAGGASEVSSRVTSQQPSS